MVLWGHRSIVNQARYNKKKCILATSGVEKVIKLWRPFESENWDGDLENYLPNEPPYARTIYSNEEYARMHPGIGHSMTHDYSLECTEEDQQMMAFFDMLVQRELESWKSDGDDDTESDKSSSSSDESRQASTLQSESDGRGKEFHFASKLFISFYLYFCYFYSIKKSRQTIHRHLENILIG